MTDWIQVEGVIVGYLMPEMNDPRWDFIQCHGEILVVRDDNARIWLRSIINDVFLVEDQTDPELNLKVGDRVVFTTNDAEQLTYSYVK